MRMLIALANLYHHEHVKTTVLGIARLAVPGRTRPVSSREKRQGPTLDRIRDKTGCRRADLTRLAPSADLI